MNQSYKNRREAGKHLGNLLKEDYGNRDDVLVLGLPRGGVPVAFEVANTLDVPLDVFVVRKLGVPGQEELAMGAIASGGTRILNQRIVSAAGIAKQEIERVTAHEREELRRREQSYRNNRPEPEISGKTVILVDDGLATGASMRSAVVALRQLDPAQIVVAVPAAPPETCAEFKDNVDRIICAITPKRFGGVGRWYHDFSQTTDDEVRQLLHEAAQREMG